MFVLGNRKIDRTYHPMSRQRNDDRVERPQYADQLRMSKGMNQGSFTKPNRRREQRMLDLGTLTTEECAYPKCEGGLTCAAARPCVARKAKVVGSHFARRSSRRTPVNVTLQLGQFRSVWRDAVVSMMSSPQRHPAPMTVNPVRQCARCGAVTPGVAQASPLFSDHAPREVHLWQ